MADFQGFPVAALDFYDDLELDNTRSFWTEHKHVYDESVAAPMKALTDALEPEFGKAKLFRPYRDVRFAKDKTPYKSHQGAYVSVAASTGYYVQVSAGGVRTGAGHYDADAATLARIRDAIVDDRLGRELEDIVGALVAEGFELGGEKLKTRPRGYDAEHARIELLRHRSMTVGHVIGFEPVVHTAELLDLVRADWRRFRPLVDWFVDRR